MKKKMALSEANAKKLVNKLARDAELRYSYAKQFKVEANIPKGAKFFSNRRGFQTLVKTKDGFIRNSAEGNQDFFNKHGRLKKMKYKSGYTINFIPADRENDKELKTIKDSSGHQLSFIWYPAGRVKSISLSEKRKATYFYKNKDKFLDYSVDLAGNRYDYKYEDPNYNLTGIQYKDKTKTKITYDRKTQLVSSVTKRDGEKTSYEHGANPKNPELHYWTEVTKPGFGGKPITNRYEYEIRIKPDGQQYTYKTITVINGLRTETIFSECCGQPLKIAKGKRVTSFEYDDGLLKKKTLPDGKTIALEYDKGCRKVSKVVDSKAGPSFATTKNVI